MREFRVDDVAGYAVGQMLDVSLFAAGESVDITGLSKGKGFAGTIKRHHFRRGPETHGSDSHRAPGSIGGGTTPGKVFKGTGMAGHMGHERVTVKGATIVRTDAERNLLLVRGPVPGARNALVLVRKAYAMPITALFDKSGAEIGTIDLPDALFAAPVNNALMHQAVVAQLAGRRIGTAATKTRGMVRGGGRKPYRQKGTGRARQGSRSAPHYAGGGVVFGPSPRSYEKRLPKRMKRSRSWAPSPASFDDGAIKVVSDLALDEIRTRQLVGHFEALQLSGRVLVVEDGRNESLELSARNLPEVTVIRSDSLNVVDVLAADVIVITAPSIPTMAEVYA